jgi:hypothetical protein
VAVRKEITVQHDFSQEEIAEAVKATLLLLGGCEERSPLTFESDICTTWIEWPGFRLAVDVTGEGILKIASESKVPWALFDWGANREKIKIFIDSLKHTFLISGLAKSKPEAYSSFISDESTHIRSSSPGHNFFTIFNFFLLVFLLMVVLSALGVCIVLFIIIAVFLGVSLSAA